LSGRGATAPIVVVSGLPRSGTAMTMRMLGAGGVPLLADAARPADADNPRGYYELAAVKSIRRDASFLDAAAGHAVKVVSPLLDALPRQHAYDVVLVRRPLAEILASQAALLRRTGRAADGTDERAVAEALVKHLVWLEGWARAAPAGVRVHELAYRHVVESPREAAAELAGFLERALDVAAMAAVVEPALYRQRLGDDAPAAG
jgi:hypothetical protein